MVKESQQGCSLISCRDFILGPEFGHGRNATRWPAILEIDPRRAATTSGREKVVAVGGILLAVENEGEVGIVVGRIEAVAPVGVR